ncbi:unnamed protein product [Macrosiphum euphorbiae]|uniref:Uncharacterized protein n=1 Tax=Macrosiphum euphorbiae TaxID=13131 RepID=A0AAV0WET7_9HEMI|nr:unnamed protein product [Macrosiphum euphorbiae]
MVGTNEAKKVPGKRGIHHRNHSLCFKRTTPTEEPNIDHITITVDKPISTARGSLKTLQPDELRLPSQVRGTDPDLANRHQPNRYQEYGDPDPRSRGERGRRDVVRDADETTPNTRTRTSGEVGHSDNYLRTGNARNGADSAGPGGSYPIGQGELGVQDRQADLVHLRTGQQHTGQTSSPRWARTYTAVVVRPKPPVGLWFPMVPTDTTGNTTTRRIGSV